MYFTTDATAEQIEAGVELARSSSLVADVESIDPDSALREFEAFAGLGDALELLDDNPLPHSLRLSLVGFADLLDLEELAERFEGAEGVDVVVVEKHWLERLAALTTLVKRLGLLIGVLFAIGAVLVTAASVRLAIEERLEELRVQKLVGRIARLPAPAVSLFWGALRARWGAARPDGAVVCAGCARGTAGTAIARQLRRGLESGGLRPQLPDGRAAMLGALLGLFGAWLASRQRLKTIEIV